MKGEKEGDYFISGMTIISEEEILYVDTDNVSLNVFNPKDGKITPTLKTSSTPSHVTTFNSSSSAIT